VAPVGREPVVEAPPADPSPRPAAPPSVVPSGAATPRPGGSRAATPRAAVPRGFATPRKKVASRHDAGDFDWQVWWRENRYLYLHPRQAAVTPRSSDSARNALRLLESTLTSEAPVSLAAEVAVALGRAHGDGGESLLMGRLERRGEEEQPLVLASCLGLALRGEGTSPVVLRDMVLDDERALLSRCSAAVAAGLLHGNDADTAAALLQVARSQEVHEDLSAICALALAQGTGGAHLVELSSWLEEEASPFLRGHVVAALSLTGDLAATRPLLGALSDEDFHVRLATICALGALHEDRGLGLEEGDATHSALVALIRIATADAHDWNRGIAALAVGRIGGKMAVDHLRDLAGKDRGQVRAAAGLGLGLAGAREAEGDILALLQDPRESVECRAAAPIALGLIGSLTGASRAALAASLARKESLLVRYTTSLAFGMVRDGAAASLLTPVVLSAEESPYLRRAAAYSLGLVGSPRAVETAGRAIARETDPEVRGMLVSSLASSPRAVESLVAMLEKEELPVRQAAAHALGHALEKHHATGIERLLSHRSPFLRVEALDSLRDRL